MVKLKTKKLIGPSILIGLFLRKGQRVVLSTKLFHDLQLFNKFVDNDYTQIVQPSKIKGLDDDGIIFKTIVFLEQSSYILNGSRFKIIFDWNKY